MSTATRQEECGDQAFSPAMLVCAFGLYIGLHYILGFVQFPVLGLDYAEQAFLGQTLEWGYSGQPPLYTWLVWLLFQCFGVGPFALHLLKAILLACTYGFAFGSGRLYCDDRRRAFLATLALWLIPPLVCDAVGDLTHTALLAAVCSATLYLFLRVAAVGRSRDYFLFGLALGMGVLSKYNYVLFAGPLLLAALTVPRYRARLLTWRGVAALAVAVMVLLPHGLWVVQHGELVRDFLTQRAGADPTASYGAGFVRAAGSLLTSLFVLLVPASLALSATFSSKASRTSGSCSEIDELPSRALAFTLLLLVLLVFTGYATRLCARWLLPTALFLPLAWAGRLGASLRPRQVSGFVVVCVAAAVLSTGHRCLRIVFDSQPGGKAWERRVWLATQAHQARVYGFDDGTLLVPDHLLGGNLRLHFPRARVLCPDFPAFRPAGKAVQPYLFAGWEQPGVEPEMRAVVLCDQLRMPEISASIYSEGRGWRASTSQTCGFVLLTPKPVAYAARLP